MPLAPSLASSKVSPTLSSRRPRPSLQYQPPPTYVLPPPVAASLLAVVSVSVTLALHTLFTPPSTTSPFYPLIRLGRHLRSSLTIFFPPRPPLPSTAPLISVQQGAQAQLEPSSDREATPLDSEHLAYATSISDTEYAELSSMRRRDLLAAALATARETSLAKAVPSARKAVDKVGAPTNVEKKEKDGRKSRSFWNVAESINGRAAALGFMLCLAREVTEPGHPSLFEQVVDVVVPIAQKTPPFLVAVCDRVVDLLT